MFGKRLREARKLKRYTRQELGKLADSSTETIGRYERGETAPKMKKIEQIAEVLGVSVSFLIANGGGDEMVSNVDKVIHDTMVQLPVWDDANTACLGGGFPIIDSDWGGEVILLPREFAGCIDRENMPFVVKTAGASMDDWEIPNGSMIVVNPSVEVQGLDIALVCYYDKIAIKKVRFLKDGGVELLASNEKMIKVNAEDNIPEIFGILGRVMYVMRKPPHGM